MGNKGKKFLALVAAITTMSATLSLAGCGGITSYKGEELTGTFDAAATVESNGGFAVKKGDNVYFINGSQTYTADNTYGDVVKGALMCISTADLESGNYSNAKIVVPSLFTTANYNAGVYIYGEYVYYATPTTDKNLQGEVENSWIDFKRAKLDGSEAPMKGQFFRLSTNSANYRFVEENGVVYCLYEDTIDGTKCLKSYNTESGDDVVLVKGAKSSFYYDMKDLTNGNVYYTMAVSYDIDSDNATTAPYDQLYTVNASATVTVDASKAAYTVKDGATYDFDEEYLKENDVDLSDYTAYPYVNLGTLVLDGVGKNSLPSMFNQEEVESTEVTGYNYTIQRYENNGVYFTRKALTTAGSTDPNLYYFADKDVKADKSISNNDFNANGPVQFVSKETTKASATALFEIENNNHVYYYVSGDKIEKATVTAGSTNVLTIARKTSGATLLKIAEGYVYYSGTGTNGKSLSRIKLSEDAEVYHPLLNNKEYQPKTLPLVDYSDSWYKPEFFGNVVLYPNAQNFGTGTVAYNYIYAARLDKIEENQTKYEAVEEYINEYSDNANSQNLIKYFFRTDLEVVEESEKQYDEDFFAEVKAKFEGENKLVKESEIIAPLSRINEDDAEEIQTSWENYLLQPEEEETTEEGLPVIAIWAIVIGSVIVVAAAVAIPTIIVLKKKAAKKREEEATVNAYKRKKIDTTDDKSIDVYADETPAEENQTEEN